MTNNSFLKYDYHNKQWFNPGQWQELMLVGAALKLDVFASLSAKPQAADKLAQSLGLDERATSIFLEALTAAGYLTIKEDVFSLTTTAKDRFGDKSNPAYLGWAVLHSWRLAERWLTLPGVIKTGEPIAEDRFSETIEGFVRAMDIYASPTAEQAVKLCLEANPEAEAVLDIGGATGTISKIFTRRGLRATLFDIPEVIETIADEIADEYPTINLIGGDFNESIPNGPFDIAFLGNITHIYGPNKNSALFRRVHEALNADGLITIQDYVRNISPSAPLFGINMLVNTTSGGTWTAEWYTEWLNTAGFGTPEFIDLTDRDQQIILAKKHQPT